MEVDDDDRLPDPLAEHAVGADGDGERLDKWAPRIFAELASRAGAAKASKKGRLLLDGRPVEGSRILRAGQRLSLLPAAPGERPTWPCALRLIYVDPHLAVVYKPAGIPVSGVKHRTVERALPVNLPTCPEVDALPSPRPAHRLDVRTQGLLLVGRSARGMVGLGRAFEAREVKKTYLAVVLGQLSGEGEVDAPVGGREARSGWRALHSAPSLHTGWITLVELRPKTGRTHQLRQHMASLGHPILGDELYTEGGPILRGNGLFLAAVGLELDHPVTGAPLSFKVDAPLRFTTTLAREARRWARCHGG